MKRKLTLISLNFPSNPIWVCMFLSLLKLAVNGNVFTCYVNGADVGIQRVPFTISILK